MIPDNNKQTEEISLSFKHAHLIGDIKQLIKYLCYLMTLIDYYTIDTLLKHVLYG